MKITGHNMFHEGWLYGLFGLAEPTYLFSLPAIEIESWQEGYRTAFETRIAITPSLIKMRELGHIIVTEK